VDAALLALACCLAASAAALQPTACMQRTVVSWVTDDVAYKPQSARQGY
jgi:hypothetical protein